MNKLATGDLVLLRRKNGIELSLVSDGPSPDDPEWFRATTLEGKVRRFPISLVVHGPIGRLSPGSDDASTALAREREQLDTRSRAVDLELLHECTLAERRAYTVDELAELLLDEPTRASRAALFLALVSDESPFERIDGDFRPLTRADLEERALERERRQRDAEERKRKAEAARAQKRVEAETLGPELKRLAMGRITPRELSTTTIAWLEGLRTHIVESPQQGSGDLPYGTGLLRIRDESHAVQLLARAGLWEPDREDLHAIRAEIGLPHPDDVIAAASALAEAGVAATDLRELPSFTVDNPSTRDLDDAISLECVSEGIRVHVHIADVARWVPPGSPLDRWGRDAGESVYLPEVTHNLYPEALVTRTSLDPGVARGAVTMRALVTPTGEVRDTTFERSIVCSDERLDYEELDRRVRDDEAWSARAQVAEWLQARRETQGAKITLLPDLEIDLGGSRIGTRVVPTDTPSHRLVAELMILYNEQVGRFFERHAVPAIFKTQPEDPTPPEYPAEEDPLYFPKIVRLLRPSISGVEAAPHAFIGVVAYCQASSPIRRYQDLVHQRQLAAVIDGETPPHTREEIEQLYPLLEARGSEVRRVERRRRRYWVLKRLHQLRGERLNGIVSQIRQGGRPIVFFPDFLLETGLLLPPDFTVEVGDEIYVTPQKVDPIRGGFWARPAG